MTCVCLRCGAGAQHTGAPVAARLSGLFLGVGLGLFLPVYMQMQMRLCLHLHLLMYMGLYVYLYLVCVRMRSYTVVCVCICIWHGKQCLRKLRCAYQCFFIEMHRVTSPPAFEESPGVWGASKRPSGLWVLSAGGKYRAAGSYRKDWCVEAGIRFAYLVRTDLCQSERGNCQNPLFQPHIFFSSRRKENVPLTVQKKRAVGGAAEEWFALPRTPC